MSSHQQQTLWSTPWSCWHLPLPFELTLLRPQFSANDHAGSAFPSRLSPYYFKTVIESAKENKRFFLERSIFDLVDAHRYLSLTDQKLLGWYLGLSQEDRKLIQDEGGFNQFLQRHPALQLSSHHVYVKYDIRPVKSTKRHTESGRKCACEVTQQECKMLPCSVKDTFSLFNCSSNRDGSQKPSHEQLAHLQGGFQTAFDSPLTQELKHQKAHAVTVPPLYQLSEENTCPMANSSSIAVRKDPAALASFSVDVELERCKQVGKEELRSHTAETQDQTTSFSYAKVETLQSEWPTIDDQSSRYFSYDPIQLDTAESSDSSCEDSGESFHSIMEDDHSILACLPLEEVTAGAGVGDSSTSDPSAGKTITAEKSTSPLPRLATCDVMVGTEQAACMPAFTQTEEPRTSDKHIITEVHMADLDYLAEVFIKLKTAEEKRREQKEEEKMKSSGCLTRKECECVERAQQAELCLLALQYSMCRQHTWRLYCTSADRDQLATLAGSPPADIVNVLQKLESDFNQMRDQIVAGVPLAQLKPLSVDCEKLTTGASYIPAQTLGDLLGNVPFSSSQKTQKPEPSGEEKRSPESQSRPGGQTEEKEMKTERRKAKRAVTLLLQERNGIHNELKPDEKQTVSCKELNSSEAWYDAEEDLCAAAADGMAEDLAEDPAEDPTGDPAEDPTEDRAEDPAEDPTGVTINITSELSSEEGKKSVLFVSNLPSNVTEHDVMMQFEKYHASEVSVSALRNGVSVAIVMISGAQCAEAAVRELNGRSMQGHTLHVEHINRTPEGQSQASPSIGGPESPRTSNTQSNKTESQQTAQPLLSSPTKTRKVVCISPIAKGTCVPQHYCTMGSFDTLMAELTQRHPDVGRQRIVDALLELKAKHQGVLSGLPLRTIRDMTSQLLTRPASPEQF